MGLSLNFNLHLTCQSSPTCSCPLNLGGSFSPILGWIQGRVLAKLQAVACEQSEAQSKAHILASQDTSFMLGFPLPVGLAGTESLRISVQRGDSDGCVR